MFSLTFILSASIQQLFADCTSAPGYEPTELHTRAVSSPDGHTNSCISGHRPPDLQSTFIADSSYITKTHQLYSLTWMWFSQCHPKYTWRICVVPGSLLVEHSHCLICEGNGQGVRYVRDRFRDALGKTRAFALQSSPGEHWLPMGHCVWQDLRSTGSLFPAQLTDDYRAEILLESHTARNKILN